MLSLTQGCHPIQRHALATISAPPAVGRHRPVPHHELAEVITESAQQRGLHVRDEQWGVSHENQRLYGAIDFHIPAWIDFPGGIGASIAVRHSNDKRMSVQLTAGARVFVCANGCFVGDLPSLRGRHTPGLNLRNRFTKASPRGTSRC
jgi:hypothetical protein